MVNGLTISDWIQCIGIFSSFLFSFVAIIISIRTLNQNNRMIEESTRANISIYGNTVNCQDPKFYLILKNYGTSGATITKFSCNLDLSKYSYDENHIPFSHIEGMYVAPNQSFMTNLNVTKLFEEKLTLIFDIEYKSLNKTYRESFNIVLESYVDLIQTRAATRDKELKIISYTLQDLVEKIL